LAHFGPSLEKGADRRFDLILPSATGSGAGAFGGSDLSSALDYALIQVRRRSDGNAAQERER
jgi:hypothetical protein